MTQNSVKPPRVVRLYYRVPHASGITFVKAEPDPSSGMGWKFNGPPDDVVGSTADFTVTLSGGQEPGDCNAKVEMLTDFSTVAKARGVVEPYLEAWEVESLVSHANAHGDFSQPLRFEFQKAEVDNQPSVSFTVHAGAAHGFLKHEFPSPPSTISVSPEVHRMWRRWRKYRAEHEPLAAMGYYCLTTVEWTIGRPGQATRQAAANQYAVDLAVLNKLGDLTSEIGDENERRREHAKQPRAFTPTEREWIERVVLALIRRLGEVALSTASGTSTSFAHITLADFPAV